MAFRAGIVVAATQRNNLFEKIAMADFGVEPRFNTYISQEIAATYRCEELPKNILDLFKHFEGFDELMCSCKIRVVFGRDLAKILVEAYPEYKESIFTVEDLFGVSPLTLLRENVKFFDESQKDNLDYLVFRLTDLIESFAVFPNMIRHLVDSKS